ncbi:carbohydrate ABC transporter permease [Tenggerimyces flavus]|uniref:Carbohydrate ABC transporter permease n=1 Tax=Tenggerimyces flavus TaxID=1708749 RepID=A0ABV7YHC5_9ACTN|nr:carbohydrate ABC transporter permease [Tenggerimyces flavus]MBM7789911.1 ABC-type glycerol-3-phosphate transport system permease component [Tenggerimyces flavus]
MASPWLRPPSAPIRGVKALVIAAIVLVMLYPFAYVIFASFSAAGSTMQASLIPSEWTLDAYRAILQGGVVTRALWVSAGVTLVGTAMSVFFTITLAYGLTRTREVPGAKPILYLVLFTMLFGAGIIPNYLLVKGLGLLDTYWALILPGLISAFNMVVVRNFFMQIPTELFEAARIDGAGEVRIFTRIVLPLSKAVVAVIALFYAVGYWNSFFGAMLYLNDASKWPIQLVLNQYVLQGTPLSQFENPNSVPPPAQAVSMAVVVLATLPILVIYPFAQRYFTKGVLTGAIKG